MVHRVEQSHDLAVDADGAGNPDRLAEGRGHPFGDARLAVAGCPKQEQTASRVDGRPESSKHFLVDQQVGESALQIFFGGMLILQRLLLDDRSM